MLQGVKNIHYSLHGQHESHFQMAPIGFATGVAKVDDGAKNTK
jgi:hypothetical protein